MSNLMYIFFFGSAFPVTLLKKNGFASIQQLIVGSSGIGTYIFWRVVTWYGKEYHMGSSFDISFVQTDVVQ